jgi:hypothetical protein
MKPAFARENARLRGLVLVLGKEYAWIAQK